MSKINLLDSQIFNRIAAGEVVENPRSVIKELVENCIDAGASAITIDITGGGIESIKVTDNGSGMSFDDLKKAVLPHATSKISSIGDLNNISTLGFRGEALPSIASVSTLKITSREKGSELGNFIEYDFGTLVSSGECGAPEGTTVTVLNLFDKVPARKKFLKRASLEGSEITSLMLRFILANYDVSFKYISDGKIIYHSDGKGLQSALYSAYGKEFFDNLVFIESTMPDITLYGFVGKPGFSKHNRTFQTLIVNGRYVTNNDITYLMQSCYKDFLMTRQFPVWVIFIELPGDMVDVNVHPNKMDIKFADFSTVKKRLHTTVNDVVKSMSSMSSHSWSEINEEGRLKQYRNSTYKNSYDNIEVDPLFADSAQKANQNEGTAVSVVHGNGEFIDALKKHTARTFVFSDGNTIITQDHDEVLPTEAGQLQISNSLLGGIKASEVTLPKNNLLREKPILGQIMKDRVISSDSDCTLNSSFLFDENGNKISNDPNFLFDENGNKISNSQSTMSDIVPHGFSLGENNLAKISGDFSESSADCPIDGTGLQSNNSFGSNLNFSDGDNGTIALDGWAQGELDIGNNYEIKVQCKIFNTYILVEFRNNVYIIDQHAAHERIIFDEIMSAHSKGSLIVQPLLLPYIFDLQHGERQILDENIEELEKIGFSISKLSGNSYSLGSVPYSCVNINCCDFIKYFFDNLGKNPLKQSDLIKENAAKAACKAAIKGNDDLEIEEINMLLGQLLSAEKLFCPHGRPIIVKISKAEIEKWFKRIT